MISIARLSGLPVLTVFGRYRVRTWGSRGRGVRSFLCWNFPGCLSVGSLNVIITLGCGIPLGNPREIVESAKSRHVIKSKKNNVPSDGEMGGRYARPVRVRGCSGVWRCYHVLRCGVSTLFERGEKDAGNENRKKGCKVETEQLFLPEQETGKMERGEGERGRRRDG